MDGSYSRNGFIRNHQKLAVSGQSNRNKLLFSGDTLINEGAFVGDD